MKREKLLGPRLEKCASFVEPGAALADIGTDHGYLPIFLLREGRIRSAVASDIGEGPLRSAVKNAEKYGVTLKTVLSDGFRSLSPEEFDTAVLAGMGGELIARILGEAEFLREKEKGKNLILQPMTSAPGLRRFLHEAGFLLIREEAVWEKGKLYTVMLARYEGPGPREPLHPLALYMGALRPEDPCSRDYAEKVLARLEKERGGARCREDLARCTELSRIMDAIQKTYLTPEEAAEVPWEKR